MRLWDLRTRRTATQVANAHSMGILSLLHDEVNSNNILISHGRDGMVKQWDMNALLTNNGTCASQFFASSSESLVQQQFSFCAITATSEYVITPDASNTSAVRCYFQIAQLCLLICNYSSIDSSI